MKTEHSIECLGNVYNPRRFQTKCEISMLLYTFPRLYINAQAKCETPRLQKSLVTNSQKMKEKIQHEQKEIFTALTNETKVLLLTIYCSSEGKNGVLNCTLFYA